MTNGFDDIPFFDEEPEPRGPKSVSPEPVPRPASTGGLAARAMAARGKPQRPSYLEGLNEEQRRAVETTAVEAPAAKAR